MTLVVAVLLPVSTGCDSGGSDPGVVDADTTLGGLAAKHDLLFGTASESNFAALDANYTRLLGDQFSVVTPGNAMKWDAVHPSRTTYRFTDADLLVDFAESRGMKVRGHTLLWHSQLPFWLRNGNWTRQELIDILQDHIQTVVTRYKGRVYAWDVVNEVVDDNGSMRNTIWLEKIGPEYIAMAFEFAHAADPDARLYLNDYNTEGSGAKSDRVYQIVTELVDAGVPIHGVGLQMHVTTSFYPSVADLTINMRRLGDLGLDVDITEMDVRMQMPESESKLAGQAAIYRNVLDVCLAASNCKAFTIWGFTDKHSWVPGTFQGFGAALPWDADYEPKPAYWALRAGLGG